MHIFTHPDTHGNPRHSALPLAAVAGAIGAVMLSLFVLPFHPALSLAVVFLLSSVLYAGFALLVRRVDLPARLVFILMAGAVLLRLCFLWMTPVGSDDFYRYIWDGRVLAHGINPYAYAPNDPALDALHSEEIPARVNHPEFRTVYFPLSLWTFYLSYEAGGEGIWAYKAMLLLAEIATLWGLVLLLRMLSLPLKYVLLYALCPLPVIEFAIDAHLDGLGLPFLLFGIYFFYRNAHVRAAVLLGLSMSIKPVALVLLPVFFFRSKSWRDKSTYLVVPLAAVLLQFAPYMAGARPFDALFAFAKNWTFNGAVFESINALLRNNQDARLACAGLLIAALLLLYVQKRMQTFDMLYFAVLLLFLFSPVVHPWYVNWLAVLVPCARRWSGVFFLSLVSLTTITTTTYIVTGVWHQPWLVLALEYLPVIALMIWELAQAARGSAAPVSAAERGSDATPIRFRPTD